MSRGIATTFAKWRFLLLTLLICAFLLTTPLIAFVRRQRTLTIDSIFATVAAYLLVALLFTQLYLFLITWDPASFSLPVEVAGRPAHLLHADMAYFRKFIQAETASRAAP